MKIPQDVRDRFEEKYHLYAEHSPHVVMAVGDTLLKIAIASEIHGLTCSQEQIDEASLEIILSGDNPNAVCMIVLIGENASLDVELPDEFEGYRVFIQMISRPQEQ